MVNKTCEVVGDANPDIAGIGILLSFTIQGFISFVTSGYYWLNLRHPSKWDGFVRQLELLFSCCTVSIPTQDIVRAPWDRRAKKLDIAVSILFTSSDVLTITGIALLLSALVQNNSLPLYHLHIIYDTASFVFVTNCAAIVCSYKSFMEYKTGRYALTLIFTTLYLIYVILFGNRLRGWNLSEPGHCYSTSLTAARVSKHPDVDYAYLVLTCTYALISLGMAIRMSLLDKINRISMNLQGNATRGRSPLTPAAVEPTVLSLAETQNIIAITMVQTLAGGEDIMQLEAMQLEAEEYTLGIALVQYPLHVWSIFALRAANDKLLTAGITEQEWGFGQIVSMVLLGSNVVALCNGIGDYQTWKRRRQWQQDTADCLEELALSQRQAPVAQNASIPLVTLAIQGGPP